MYYSCPQGLPRLNKHHQSIFLSSSLIIHSESSLILALSSHSRSAILNSLNPSNTYCVFFSSCSHNLHFFKQSSSKYLFPFQPSQHPNLLFFYLVPFSFCPKYSALSLLFYSFSLNGLYPSTSFLFPSYSCTH